VNVGTNGSSQEECFAPALAALTAPLISDPMMNGGFLRTDAPLAVVCVTDELEQSPQSVSYYYNQFLNIKGVRERGDPSGGRPRLDRLDLRAGRKHRPLRADVRARAGPDDDHHLLRRLLLNWAVLNPAVPTC
jgi:hypothetical protein